MTGTWATGWATGDIVTAAEFRKGMGSIYDTTLGASAASIDITSIVGSYAHLLCVLYSRSDFASAGGLIQMRFNADAGANYDYQYQRGNAAVASAAETFASGVANIGLMPGGSALANLFGGCLLFIPHYANTVNNKEYVSLATAKTGTATSNMYIDAFGGSWRSTAAINRITFLPFSGNFVAGTRATIYGMGA